MCCSFQAVAAHQQEMMFTSFYRNISTKKKIVTEEAQLMEVTRTVQAEWA